MNDVEFHKALLSHLMKSNDKDGVHPMVPIFRDANGVIDREKTLALPCYEGMVVNP